MTKPGNVFQRFARHALPSRPWQLAVVGLFGALAAGVVALALVALVLTPTLPSVRNLSGERLKVPMRVYTADGQLIAEFGEERRIPVTIEQVPDTLIKAVLAAEDHSFFYHHGVDFLGILRAAWYDLRTHQSTGQGGSTITMQVARNYFLSPEKTYTRKLKEVLLAFKIEQELTKNQILTLYLNKIFLGHRAYGFAAAAQVYYGKTLPQLTLPEMAMLAGLPKAPSRDNPITNPVDAVRRRNYVLRQMRKLGFIDRATWSAARAAPLTASLHAVHPAVHAPYVAEMVRQYMVRAYDQKTYDGGFNVYTTIDARDQRAADAALRAGLLAYDRRHGYRGPVGHVSVNAGRGRLDDALKDYRVVSDMVPGVVLRDADQSISVYTQDGDVVQVDWPGLSWARPYLSDNAVGPVPQHASDIVQPGDIVYLDPGTSAGTAGTWRLAQIPKVSGALVSLRPSDGAVVALAGGFDFYESGFNRVTDAERQPGSSFKPFIFTAALAKGFTAASTVSGAPIVVPDASLEGEWRPENYEHKFYGPTRLRKALALSLNLVAVRLLRDIGPDYAVDYLQRFGFDPTKLPRDLSLALGTATVTPMQMASAYAVFANGGFRVEPYFIERVEDANHHVLEQANPAVACPACAPGIDPKTALPVAANAAAPRLAPRVVSASLDFIITSMMQDVIREGTGEAARALNRDDLAGKTGTTNDFRDAWFSGFNRDRVATAWVGFDTPASLGHGEAGARAALPIWMDYMRVALAGRPQTPPVPPPDVVQVLIDRGTGRAAPAGDPNALAEYFIKGTAPAPSVAQGQGSVKQDTRPEDIRENLF